jgi:predicted O-methyltransferase YrrM
MPDLAVIVPTRGRPENIRRVISAWDFTNAWDHADLILAVDADDPHYPEYRGFSSMDSHPNTRDRFALRVREISEWAPMVHKLNRTAVDVAGRYFAVGFAGDDHLPQTIGWAERYLTVLREMGTGMVYGDDGYQGIKLSTEWAVTSDVVRALGQMVPAPVEHMYCDNAMMDLFNGAGALRHLPEVRIEHRHPVVGKAETDAQYQRVNHRDQFRKDRLAYERWKSRPEGMNAQISVVRDLRPDAKEYQVAAQKPVRPAPRTRTTRGQIRRSGPTSERIGMARFPFSKEFKEVRGATPDEVGMALADFAVQVPADQEIVELGVYQGRTALIMAWGAKQGPGAHVTAIDPWDLEGNVYDPPFTDAQSKTWAEYRIRELGYTDRITLVQGFSHDVAVSYPEPWFSGGKMVGLLFVDGDHTRDGARRDIEAWAPNLAPGAIIAVDDYGHPDWPGVAEAVDELVAEGFLAPVTVYHDRLAVTRLTSTVEDVDAGTEPTQGEGWTEPRVTAITSEGVSPSPEDDWMAEPDVQGEVSDDVADLEASAEELTRRGQVQVAELRDVTAGTPIEELNTVQLRALAKVREITLGSRKDKRDAMLQALRDGA